MTSRLETIFHEAIEIEDRNDRLAFLDRACADDEALRVDVDAMLAAHDEAGNFLTTVERHAENGGASNGESPASRLETDPARSCGDMPLPLEGTRGRRTRGPGVGFDITKLERPMAEGPGTVIDRYKLLEQIGEGGFGIVFMAEQERPIRRRVALKILKPGMDTKQVLARFEAERQALALMDHPNIARVLDAGATDGGRPYFVMELVRGDAITTYCDRENMTTRERLELFRDVCSAVQHAHSKGVIHRDLKPTNVLVTTGDGGPVAKVIDFGVAKATSQRLTDRTLFTEFRQIIGTLEYMSPEQADTSSMVDVDTRADVYSLGVLLYELLTGSTPFSGEELREAGMVEMLRIIRESEPPRPSTRLSTLGEAVEEVARRRCEQPRRLGMILRGDLDWIVMKAIEKERTRRYDTPSALARDLERFLADEPVEATPPSAAYRTRKFVRRHRLKVVAALVVLTALLLGAVGTTAGLFWALEERGEAEEARVLAQEKEAVARAETLEILINAAGHARRDRGMDSAAALLDRVPEQDRTTWWHMARRQTTSEYVDFDQHGRLLWSPDGSLAISNFDKDDLAIVDGRSLEVIHSTARQSTDGEDFRVHWCPEGDAVVMSATVGGKNGHRRMLSVPDLEPLGPYVYVGSTSSYACGNGLLVAANAVAVDALVKVFDLTTGEIVAQRRLPGLGLAVKKAVRNYQMTDWFTFIGADGGRAVLVSLPHLEQVHVLDERTDRHVPVPGDAGVATVRYERRRLECWRAYPDRPPALAWWVDAHDVIADASVNESTVVVIVNQSIVVHDLDTGAQLYGPIDVGASVRPGPSLDLVGRRLAASIVKHGWRMFDLDHWERPFQVRMARTTMKCLDVTADGRLAAVASWDAFFEGDPGSLRVIDVRSCREVARLLDGAWQVGNLGISPRGSYLAANVFTVVDEGRRHELRVWSLRSGRLLWSVDAKGFRKVAPVFNEDESELTAGWRRFRSEDGKLITEPTSGREGGVVLSDDRRYMIEPDSAAGLEFLRVVDRSTGELVSELRPGAMTKDALLAISPDSTRIFVPYRVGGSSIFDLQHGFEIARLPRSESSVMAGDWSDDGSFLATGGTDQLIRIWDTRSLRLLGVLAGHERYVRQVCFLPDNESLVSISGDGTFRLWASRTPVEQHAEVERRRAIIDSLSPWIEQVVADSVDEDAADARAAVASAGLSGEDSEIAQILLSGALLSRHSSP